MQEGARREALREVGSRLECMRQPRIMSLQLDSWRVMKRTLLMRLNYYVFWQVTWYHLRISERLHQERPDDLPWCKH